MTLTDDAVVGTLWEDDPYRHTETVYPSDLNPEIQALIRAGTAAEKLASVLFALRDLAPTTYYEKVISEALAAYQAAIGGDE